jgi:hypothetical protein
VNYVVFDAVAPLDREAIVRADEVRSRAAAGMPQQGADVVVETLSLRASRWHAAIRRQLVLA